MNYYVYPGLRIKPKISQLDKLKVILLEACSFTGIEPFQVLGRSRKGQTAYTRHLFCVMARRFTTYGTNRIGDYINRDHSTVINSTQTISNLCDTEEQVKEDVKILSDKMEKRFI